MQKSETYEAVCLHQPVAEGLNIVIEVGPEGELMIDQAASESDMELVGVQFLDPERFHAERDKKTFAHDGGHALLAYLGAS